MTTPTARDIAVHERLVDALTENIALHQLVADLRAENTKLRERNNHRGRARATGHDNPTAR